ncbi:hypothetical protein DPSP01_009601 [Paraphaeosphaeria sporulosa]|uniref:PSP1-domain-containing protein n=1 Tax=Paraphaeosphaeria sporulosa TaxID=1460663 RepID=A0A177CYH6_9PLEO|nr:PSP1-domain-containing protein [Paraphaeosphaeria sporulosa]OAG11917.1 PSP1-domain-containing protein [Paraphaeosphaeria sporulosa]
MASTPFKNSLTVGGSPFDKAKLQMRRPTPDSDVLASSDDDHEVVAPPPTRPTGAPFPTARRPSWMAQDLPNRKNSLPSVSLGSQPGTPSLSLDSPSRAPTFWNTNSFTAASSANRLKEVLPSPTSAQGPVDKPFGAPPQSETDDTVGFLLNQHTVRKAVRSQSYSVGQGEIGNPASHLRSALRHRPSKPSLLATNETAVGLGQLREDENDELDSSNGSQHGVPLHPDFYQQETRPSKAMVTKQVTIIAPPARRLSHSMRSMTQNDADDVAESAYDTRVMPLTRRYSEHVGTLAQADDFAQSHEPHGWGGSVPRFNTDALSRRHSIAHYGSNLASTFSQTTLGNTQEEEEEASPLETVLPVLPPAQNDPKWSTLDYFSGFGPAARTINSSAISAAHPAPTVNHPPPPPNAYANPSGYGRPGRRIYVVQFKCSRSDIYYLYENTGLEIRVGDLVIVEGDRGHDLGQVTHADVTMDDAKRLKNEANEDHFRWLVMFSQYSVAGASAKNAMLGALFRAHEVPKTGNRPQLTGMGVQQDPENKPRMIRRLAQTHEILQLRDKEGEEARAKRMATDKALDHNLPMEILDAEFQWDHHKISFFYYAESYVDFKILVTDLFKHYKIRIWMSAVNPASVVNPAGMQIKPPSAIGPGAIVPNNAPNASLSVGPLFGNNSYRPNEQYGNRDRSTNPQGSFGANNFGPFSHQLSGFPVQNPYQMQQWGQQFLNAGMYSRYDPNATADRSPMNMGGWFPPATYSASPAFNQASSNASFRGGYPASSANNPYAASTAVAASAYSTAFNAQAGFPPSSATGAAPFVGFDPDMMAAMASLNLGGAGSPARNTDNNNGGNNGANSGSGTN